MELDGQVDARVGRSRVGRVQVQQVVVQVEQGLWEPLSSWVAMEGVATRRGPNLGSQGHLCLYNGGNPDFERGQGLNAREEALEEARLKESMVQEEIIVHCGQEAAFLGAQEAHTCSDLTST